MQALYESENNYKLDVNLENVIKEKINGKYVMTVHCEDSRANNVAFTEENPIEIIIEGGNEDNQNDGIREDFKLFEIITNYFPPEEEQKGFLIPAIFAGALGLLFLWNLGSTVGIGANLSNISFWGFLFTLDYLLILGVIVAFWIKVNLIITLWTLVFLAPFTLILMNFGLTAENCHISAFSKMIKASK
jgi:hypothetical protein